MSISKKNISKWMLPCTLQFLRVDGTTQDNRNHNNEAQFSNRVNCIYQLVALVMVFMLKRPAIKWVRVTQNMQMDARILYLCWWC